MLIQSLLRAYFTTIQQDADEEYLPKNKGSDLGSYPKIPRLATDTDAKQPAQHKSASKQADFSHHPVVSCVSWPTQLQEHTFK